MSEYRDEHAARRAEIDALTQDLEARRAELGEVRDEHARLTARVAELERMLSRLRQSAGPRDRTDKVLETIVYVPIATGVVGMFGTIVAGLVVGIPLMLMGFEAKAWFFYALEGVFVVCGAIGLVRSLRSIWRRPHP